jgi:uncharacterized protein (UPF0297 family)
LLGVLTVPDLDNTMQFTFEKDLDNPVKGILRLVCAAMREKGYDPANQLIGYIVSGDPTYITGYKNARSLIASIDRDELLEEFVTEYIEKIAD